VTYTGETNERGEAHGQGVKEWVAVSRYEGEWKDDKRHGRRGVCEYADGSRYEGEWKDGKRHGRGEIKYADGTCYQGEWKDGKKHGGGLFFSPKHFEAPRGNADFFWRIYTKFKEGHLDGERMLFIVKIGDGAQDFETDWENGLLVAIEGLRRPEEEVTPVLEKLREEIEQRRVSDSNQDEGLN